MRDCMRVCRMTCRFLENFSLRSIIAPVSKDAFRTRYWEQKPLLVHRRDPGFYADLFTLRDFDHAIAASPEFVKIANEAAKKHVSYKSEAVRGLEETLADMRNGGTLVLDQMQKHNRNLSALCRLMAAELGHRFQTNLYLTPPNGRGFPPHWDDHDVFILQVLGSKHWKIEKERRAINRKGERMGAEGRELRGDLLSFTLEQGDLIYIPRGFVHAAECGAEPSLHITLGLTGSFYEDFLNAVLQVVVASDPSLRAILPPGFMRGEGEDLVIERIKSALVRASEQLLLPDVLTQFRAELVKEFTLDAAGQVVEFFTPAPLTPDTQVGPREGIVYQTQSGDDFLRVTFGTRNITFPGFLRDSVEFALSIPTFLIRELPGQLEDDERVAVIDRLIQEGMVMRKPSRSDGSR